MENENVTANIEGVVESTELNLGQICDLARRIDEAKGVEPPAEYGLAEATAAILSRGSIDQIQMAMILLQGWDFTPEGGWPSELKGELL